MKVINLFSSDPRLARYIAFQVEDRLESAGIQSHVASRREMYAIIRELKSIERMADVGICINPAPILIAPLADQYSHIDRVWSNFYVEEIREIRRQAFDAFDNISFLLLSDNVQVDDSRQSYVFPLATGAAIDHALLKALENESVPFVPIPTGTEAAPVDLMFEFLEID